MNYTESNVRPMGEVMEQVVKTILNTTKRINDLEGDTLTKFSHIGWTGMLEAVADACKNYPVNVFISTLEAFENPAIGFRIRVMRAAAELDDTIMINNPAPRSELLPLFKHDEREISAAAGFPSLEAMDKAMHPIIDPLIDKLNDELRAGTMENTTQRAAVMANYFEPIWNKENRGKNDLLAIGLAVSMVVAHGQSAE